MVSSSHDDTSSRAQGLAMGSRSSEGSLKEAAQAFLQALDKTLRMHMFYEGKGSNYEKTMDMAFHQLNTLLSTYEVLPLKISPYEFLLGEDPVYVSEEEKQGITFRLFRDGLRELTILNGIDKNEFTQLLEVMRGAQPGESESNTVTLLWERNPKHLRFRAISAFQEGTEDTDRGGAQENINRVYEVLRRPLHKGREVKAPPPPSREVEARFSTLRRAVEAKLAEADPESFRAALKDRMEGTRDDLWRRAIHIAGRLVQVDLGAEYVSGLLAQILEEMLVGGRWDELGETCKVMAATISQAGGSKEGQGLRKVATGLANGHKLLSLQDRLNTANLEEFAHLLPLFELLPPEANEDLRTLLLHMPAGEVQDRLQAFLASRGTDLTEVHAKNLKSSNQEQVIEAINTLKAIGTDRAMTALAEVLGHPSARIRLEALRTLRGTFTTMTLPPPVVVHIIASLGSGHQELQDLCFDLLEHLPRCTLGRDLLDLMREKEKELTWDERRYKQAYRMLVRWGGTGVDEWIGDRIAAHGLFVRRKQEEIRDELIAALETTGGDRALSLISAIKGRRLSAPVRERLDQVAAQINSRRTTKK